MSSHPISLGLHSRSTRTAIHHRFGSTTIFLAMWDGVVMPPKRQVPKWLPYYQPERCPSWRPVIHAPCDQLALLRLIKMARSVGLSMKVVWTKSPTSPGSIQEHSAVPQYDPM